MRPRRRRWPLALRVTLWTLGAAVVLVAAYVGWLSYSFVRFQNRIYVPVPPTPTAQVAYVEDPAPTVAPQGPVAVEVAPSPSPTPDDPFRNLPAGRVNILLLGTDVRPHDTDQYGRSDTIILLNLDTVTRQVRILTIPRDLAVNIPGYGRNKINAAYFLGQRFNEPGGGPGLAMRTVSQLLNVPVDYYMLINFQGFRSLVDSIGGIDIDVPYDIYDPAYPSDDPNDPYGTMVVQFNKGLQHMNGTQALRYARTRHQDSDFMRSKRQLQVIMAIRQKALHLDVIPMLPSLMDQLGNMMATNVPPDKQLDFARAAYEIGSSSVATASIDNRMVTDQWLPDGSQALKLDWTKAQPMLDQFFGRTQGEPTPAVGAQRVNGVPTAAVPAGPEVPVATSATAPTPGARTIEQVPEGQTGVSGPPPMAPR